MTIREYQKQAMRTICHEHDNALEACLGLIGEGGELVDTVKKYLFQGTPEFFPREQLIDECGDILWYCAELMTSLHDDLHELYYVRKSTFDDVVHNMMTSSTIVSAAALISLSTGRPYVEFFETDLGNDKTAFTWKNAQVKAETIGILVSVREFLEKYCDCSLEEAMQHNIDKLLIRYPNGFDPEKSINRYKK